MIGRITKALRRLRRRLSRNEWAIRIFGLSRLPAHTDKPGLVIVQVDGLSRTQFERALERGRLPFLRKLIQHKRYRVHTLYSGLPATTAAVQAELFYGVKVAVPAFCFRDYKTGRTVRMVEPNAVAAIERDLARQGEPLFKDGAVYSDIFTGGAAESHFCPASAGWAQALRGANPFGIVFLVITNFYSFIRTILLLAVEFVLAIIDMLQGGIAGHHLVKELKFVPMRVAICIGLRELVTIGAKIDIARGLPVIHVNFVGYDEQSHRRGPRARFAHWSLKGIDDSIARIWREAQICERREYQVWVYADHGQEQSLSYPLVHGRSVEEAVRAVFANVDVTGAGSPRDWRDVQSYRAALLGAGQTQKLSPATNQNDAATETAKRRMEVAALGPVGFLYVPEGLTPEDRARVARALVERAHIPMALFFDALGRLTACTGAGILRLPDDRAQLFGAGHPFVDELTDDLHALCAHPCAGDLVICGWRAGTPHYTFPHENGSHGGMGTEETRAFALLPADTRLPARDRDYLRPLDLHQAALHQLGRREITDENVVRSRRKKGQPVRIMTYNVHSCRGLDGKVAPERIARVIADYEPDIVALQELDVGRPRTGGVDQAHLIARYLKMDFHFHPALRVAEEQYGDAILTHLPMRLIKADRLPGHPSRPGLEPRGALWVAITVDDIDLQVINTHLGLRRTERVAQMRELLDAGWLADPACQPPLVLCGDFNGGPLSTVYRLLSADLRDAQKGAKPGRPKNTWFSGYPTRRIDHIFVDPGIEVVGVEVPSTRLVRIASDHLPVIAEIRLPV
ncbi:MAG: endonuclease/exonuclease/phosphatase family protein [Chromatiales bacterium]